MGAMINRTCCVKHVNYEYVSTDVDEDGQQTVMVRTTRDVCMGEEFLAYFGEQFTTVLVSTGCECCACTRATAECREVGTCLVVMAKSEREDGDEKGAQGLSKEGNIFASE